MFFSIALTKAMLTLYSHKILIQTFHTIDLHPQETLLHSLAELLWVGWVSSIPHLHIWKILFITLTFVHSIWDCVTLLEFYARSNCRISKQFHFGERLPSIKVLFWSNKIDWKLSTFVAGNGKTFVKFPFWSRFPPEVHKVSLVRMRCCWGSPFWSFILLHGLWSAFELGNTGTLT